MRYDRIVLAYHGCDAAVAERLLAGDPFRPSDNDYDWLGAGVYFWEYGADRALRFAHDQQRRGQRAQPTVLGALIQLGSCFDLLDTRFTRELAGSEAPEVGQFRFEYVSRCCRGCRQVIRYRARRVSRGRPRVSRQRDLRGEPHPDRGAKPGLHPRRISAHSGTMKDVDSRSVRVEDDLDNDPFYKYDEFGRPLDADTVARRAVLKRWRRMSPEEFFAEMVRLGAYNPDGTLNERYVGNEPSKYLPTD